MAVRPQHQLAQLFDAAGERDRQRVRRHPARPVSPTIRQDRGLDLDRQLGDSVRKLSSRALRSRISFVIPRRIV